MNIINNDDLFALLSFDENNIDADPRPESRLYRRFCENPDTLLNELAQNLHPHDIQMVASELKGLMDKIYLFSHDFYNFLPFGLRFIDLEIDLCFIHEGRIGVLNYNELNQKIAKLFQAHLLVYLQINTLSHEVVAARDREFWENFDIFNENPMPIFLGSPDFINDAKAGMLEYGVRNIVENCEKFFKGLYGPNYHERLLNCREFKIFWGTAANVTRAIRNITNSPENPSFLFQTAYDRLIVRHIPFSFENGMKFLGVRYSIDRSIPINITRENFLQLWTEQQKRFYHDSVKLQFYKYYNADEYVTSDYLDGIFDDLAFAMNLADDNFPHTSAVTSFQLMIRILSGEFFSASKKDFDAFFLSLLKFYGWCAFQRFQAALPTRLRLSADKVDTLVSKQAINRINDIKNNGGERITFLRNEFQKYKKNIEYFTNTLYRRNLLNIVIPQSIRDTYQKVLDFLSSFDEIQK